MAYDWLIEQKKFYTRTRIRVWGFHKWLKFQPFFWLVEIIELRKGVIIWLHRKGGGLERQSI